MKTEWNSILENRLNCSKNCWKKKKKFSIIVSVILGHYSYCIRFVDIRFLIGLIGRGGGVWSASESSSPRRRCGCDINEKKFLLRHDCVHVLANASFSIYNIDKWVCVVREAECECKLIVGPILNWKIRILCTTIYPVGYDHKSHMDFIPNTHTKETESLINSCLV